MNHEERQMLQDLFDRLRDSGNQARDPEAERFIAEQIRYQPGAPYYMAQAVIVQEQALQEAQARVAELEDRIRQLEAPPQPTGQGSFLAGRTGGLFGRGSSPASAASVPNTGAPSAGPWGRGPVVAQPQRSYSQPSYSQPAQAQQQPAPAASGGGGFLKGALATAAGVAGGAILSDQMKGMFGGGSGAAHAGTPDANQGAVDQALDEAQDEELAESYEQDGDSGGGDLEI